MKLTTAMLCGLLLVQVSAAPGQEEDFSWSWESTDEVDGLEMDPASGDEETLWVAEEDDVAPAEAGDDVLWVWDGDEPGAAPVGPGPGTPSIDAAAYDELLEENLQLREDLQQAEQRAAAVEKENIRLSAEVGDLEERVGQFSSIVQDLKADAPAAAVADLDKVIALESRLAESEKANTRLTAELAELRDRTTAALAADGAPAPEPGSALFRKVEEENLRLREEVTRLDDDLRRLRAMREQVAEKDGRIDALRDKLAKAEAAEREQKKTIAVLMDRVPELEQDRAKLTASIREKETALRARDREFEVMQEEIARREHRIVQQERMRDLLEEAQEEIAVVKEKQKRDMHYNMAVVYTKEAKFKEAEQEYLHALRIDPTDPEAHYNLAILYDDELGDEQRAASHYRRYLKLKPHSPDVNRVKEWLMAIETAHGQ